MTIEERLTEFIDWVTKFSPDFPVYKFDNVEAIDGKPVFLLDGLLTKESEVFMVVLGYPYLDKDKDNHNRIIINSAIGSLENNIDGVFKYENIPIILVEEKSITKGDDCSYLSLKIHFDKIQLYPNLFPYLKSLLMKLVEKYPETKKIIQAYLDGVNEIYESSFFDLLVSAESNAFKNLLDDLINKTWPGNIMFDLGNGVIKLDYMSEVTEPDEINTFRDYMIYAIDSNHSHMKEKILLMQIRLYDLGNENLRIVGYRCFRHPVVIEWLGNLKQEINSTCALRKVDITDTKSTGSDRPTTRTQEIFNEAKRFKDANPKLSKEEVAKWVSSQLKKHLTENSITYAYSEMGEDWPRKKTQ